MDRNFRWVAFGLGFIIASSLLAGCGGGGSSSPSTPPPVNTPPPPPPDASPGGIWQGTQTSSGQSQQVIGLITETGEFHFIQADGVQYIGALGIDGNAASGTFEAAVPIGEQFVDGSTGGGGTLTFTINERQTITGTFTFVTDAGSSSEGDISLAFNPLYNRNSSLATIAGTYTDAFAPGSDAVTVSSNGQLFYQDGSGTNCTANGQVSIINASFNAYRISFQYSGCGGSFAALNGSTFSGIGTLDNTVSPEQVVAGVTGIVQGSRFAIVYLYDRT